MKKSSMVLALLALAFSAMSMLTSSATGSCGTGTNGRTDNDPFGSCESSTGTVHCGNQGVQSVTIPSVGSVTADQNKGVQACSDDSNAIPISGRVTVYNNSGHAGVAADGGDAKNSAGAGGWDRVDVNTTTHQVCVARGSGGTYWTSGGGHSTADSVDQCKP